MSSLPKVKIIDLPTFTDDRGSLTVLQDCFPFEVKRSWYMHGIGKDRGGHAHIDTEMLIVGVAGSFTMVLRDGLGGEEHYEMSDPSKAVIVPRLHFNDFINISSDAVCLVYANTLFDDSKTIRSWDGFVDYVEQHQNK